MPTIKELKDLLRQINKDSNLNIKLTGTKLELENRYNTYLSSITQNLEKPLQELEQKTLKELEQKTLKEQELEPLQNLEQKTLKEQEPLNIDEDDNDDEYINIDFNIINPFYNLKNINVNILTLENIVRNVIKEYNLQI